MQQTASLPWYAGVIIFTGILVCVVIFKKWLADGVKKQVPPTNCCAPLVEDGDRPFKPMDDLPKE